MISKEKKQRMKQVIICLIILLGTNCSTMEDEIDRGGGNFLLVASTDFETGSLSLIDLDTLEVSRNILPLHQDNLARSVNNKPYMINRLGGDNILYLDPENNFNPVFEQSTGRGSNPHDISLWTEGKGLVSLNLKDYLHIFDLNSGSIEEGDNGKIDLSAFNDEDGKPEASALHSAGNYVYVALQKLDQNNLFSDKEGGSILRITKGQKNPSLFADITASPSSDFQIYNDKLMIIGNNSFSKKETDGGILAVDIESGDPVEAILNEVQADSIALTNFVVVNDQLGFFIGYGDSFTERHLKVFDPSSSRVTRTLIENGEFGNGFSALLVHENKLYVADSTKTRPGIRVFNLNDLQEETTIPIDVGLPPDSMAVISIQE